MSKGDSQSIVKRRRIPQDKEIIKPDDKAGGVASTIRNDGNTNNGDTIAPATEISQDKEIIKPNDKDVGVAKLNASI